MSTTSRDRLTEINAINEVLAAVGQAPVTTLDQTNPDVSIIQQTLKSVSREVQSEGWHFNKEFNVEETPQTDKTIPIKDTYLQVDVNRQHHPELDVVRRDGKLYDKWGHTDKFNGKIRLDVVHYFEWTDLPAPIQDYIIARTAALTSTRLMGDSTQYQMLLQREEFARANALEYDCNQADYTYFGHPQGENYYISYQPYKALYR
tara:strand:+ start:665 stop:1276 length:612 start_codon:yes stop_codon:yes gene_type:complete